MFIFSDIKHLFVQNYIFRSVKKELPKTDIIRAPKPAYTGENVKHKFSDNKQKRAAKIRSFLGYFSAEIIG